MKRIVSPRRLRDYAREYPQAEASLDHWEKTVLEAQWKTSADIKRTFNDVDRVKVRSGKTTYVFNIQRNEHRLIAAVHLNTGVVYVLRIMRHREYSKNHWRNEL